MSRARSSVSWKSGIALLGLRSASARNPSAAAISARSRRADPGGVGEARRHPTRGEERHADEQPAQRRGGRLRRLATSPTNHARRGRDRRRRDRAELEEGAEVGRHRRRRRIAILGILLEGFPNDRREVARNLGIQLLRRHRLVAQDPLEDLVRRRRLERPPQRQELVESDSQRKEIAPPVDRPLAGRLLEARRNVGFRRSAPSA